MSMVGPNRRRAGTNYLHDLMPRSRYQQRQRITDVWLIIDHKNPHNPAPFSRTFCAKLPTLLELLERGAGSRPRTATAVIIYLTHLASGLRCRDRAAKFLACFSRWFAYGFAFCRASVDL